MGSEKGRKVASSTYGVRAFEHARGGAGAPGAAGERIRERVEADAAVVIVRVRCPREVGPFRACRPPGEAGEAGVGYGLGAVNPRETLPLLRGACEPKGRSLGDCGPVALYVREGV